MRTLAAIAASSILLLGVSSSEQASAELFASLCSGCHNNVKHPRGLVYNAAGNVAIITAVNALGMGAKGSLADHISIATYLDSVKPTITLAPVAHNSPGTVINLGDIVVSAAEMHADWIQIAAIASVSAPTKGTVTYQFANGFARPSTVTYKPFPGQSGTDTWTYQGSGPGGTTTVRTASVVIDADPKSATNYQGLWWNAQESGWGINFAHQGDTVFATWFTYNANNKPQWFIILANKTATNVYSGDVSTVTGPPFTSDPFPPNVTVETVVGTATLTFSTDGESATFEYTVNGIHQTKLIARQEFSSPRPTCVWGMQADLTLATNYQDLWWVVAGAQAGWGINFNHQGTVIFATWFTYDANGKPLWFIVLANQEGATNVFSGDVSTVTGPPFTADPFDASTVVETVVGNAKITIIDGNHATYGYTVNGVTQTKNLTRQVFTSPGTVCQ